MKKLLLFLIVVIIAAFAWSTYDDKATVTEECQVLQDKVTLITQKIIKPQSPVPTPPLPTSDQPAFNPKFPLQPRVAGQSTPIPQARLSTIPALINRTSHAAPSATPQPKSIPRVICPVCRGEGVWVYGPDGAKPMERVTQRCPVCLGKGYRLLAVPAGKKLCPDCKGMGIAFSLPNPKKPIIADNCGRCVSTGLVPNLQ